MRSAVRRDTDQSRCSGRAFRMHVGVLGGGLQGCCIALALAERGINVTIIDRNDALLSRTAVANEGKIHLGYMYAGDPTLGTAHMMMQGALAFAPFFMRHLGFSPESFSLSTAAGYVVHRTASTVLTRCSAMRTPSMRCSANSQQIGQTTTSDATSGPNCACGHPPIARRSSIRKRRLRRSTRQKSQSIPSCSPMHSGK